MAHPPRPRVLITHPGRQHSHQAALALAGVGMLAGYWSGVPSGASHRSLVPRALWRRYASLPLPVELVRCAPWTPALRRFGDRLPRQLAFRIDFLACRLFDRWAAARLASTQPDAVIACEISALATFRAAKRRGIPALLDAPSIHHLTQDRVQPTLDPPGLHRRLARVKDAEVALADHVLTVSSLARDTYLAAGVPSAKVHALPLGVDLRVFSAEDAARVPLRGAADPVVFLFAGAAIRRKGFDLLLEAFARVSARAPSARLRVVGPTAKGVSPHSDSSAHIEVVGPVDQAALAHELRHADCLILPSRHDSYGMVVVEALAAGTPVVVSEMVGAKDLVKEGVNGWVLPLEDIDALTSRMIWCAEHSDAVGAMREDCRQSASAATWDAYHARLVDLLGGLLGGRQALQPAADALPQDAVA